MVRVLVACESSGVVAKAFRDQGHNAHSCDLLPPDSGDYTFHFKEDALSVASRLPWDLLIAHPPCTYLCSSGMHWTTRGMRDPQLTEDALEFVKALMNAPVERIAIENPVGCISTRIRKADQYIQPYDFGDDASKKTGLWLKNLPPLTPTRYIEPRIVEGGKMRWGNQTNSGQNKLGPSDDRWKARSKTFQGIANAMADQWKGGSE